MLEPLFLPSLISQSNLHGWSAEEARAVNVQSKRRIFLSLPSLISESNLHGWSDVRARATYWFRGWLPGIYLSYLCRQTHLSDAASSAITCHESTRYGCCTKKQLVAPSMCQVQKRTSGTVRGLTPISRSTNGHQTTNLEHQTCLPCWKHQQQPDRHGLLHNVTLSRPFNRVQQVHC